MKKYVGLDAWSIIEEGFHPNDNRIFESIMSLGNGHMGMRGNFEEKFSGDSLQGTYIAGVYYPDKTRVGWWKNGYPEYFAKVLNAANFIGIDVALNDEELDTNVVEMQNFRQALNMQHGYLSREFEITASNGDRFAVKTRRFLSMDKREIACIEYSVTPLTNDAKISFAPYIDGNVTNEDSNYDEIFWIPVAQGVKDAAQFVTMKTKKTDYIVTTAFESELRSNGVRISQPVENIEKPSYMACKSAVQAKKDETITLVKYVTVTTNRDYDNADVESKALSVLAHAVDTGVDALFASHQEAWDTIWSHNDVVIEGDLEAQQGIRFNIFQMFQTYNGHDARLNIGPKGFTGEKYGGVTYWDTEAYCLPFYLAASDQEVARNLLVYRHNHLEKAKENAIKLGLKGALYPMVTMNGEECHNEWEITFEELHRNAAIAYAVHHYIEYTGDEDYLHEYGFEVVAEISRFWASRVNYNTFKDCYMMLGVTGPNEYDNNVDNNWYTNTMASWTLEYTLASYKKLKETHPERLQELVDQMGITDDELEKWQDIINKMYLPYDDERQVFLQQDGFLNKEQILVKDLDPIHLPLNQNWSWDRILRSNFIKQADVLQGIYFLSERFDIDTKRRNFDFYEPRTVHESSLSPCIHSIIAGEIGYEDKAHELYLRTARLDLDNYNNDTEDGLHITSMAGTWMSIVMGFGGMRTKGQELALNPFIPKAWDAYSFKFLYRGRQLKVTVNHETTSVSIEKGETLTVKIADKYHTIDPANGALVL